MPHGPADDHGMSELQNGAIHGALHGSPFVAEPAGSCTSSSSISRFPLVNYCTIESDGKLNDRARYSASVLPGVASEDMPYLSRSTASIGELSHLCRGMCVDNGRQAGYYI